jgi:Tfp pilus assembly protein PilO
MSHHLLTSETRRFGRLLHYLGLLAVVVLAATGYSLFHSPILEDISNAEERINELTLSVENAARIHEQHEKVSRLLAAVKERIANVQKRVPHEPSAGDFLKEVTQIAAEENLAVRDFQPGKPQARDGYTQMEVTLIGRGSYASVCTFFDRLARLPRLSKLQNLTLNAGGNATEYPMTVTLVIYYSLRAQSTAAEAAGQGRAGGSGEVKRG